MVSTKFFKKFLLTLLICFSSNFLVLSADKAEGEDFNMGEMIMHHVLDDYQYEIMHGLVIPLPGFKYYHGKLKPIDQDASYVDLSITKNVAFLILTATLMILVFLSVAKGYSKKNSAPKGIQALFEPVIIFVRDDIVKPNIGENYEKYLPYMLTLFFFIFFGNVLGLMPGAANLTGNIAVTLSLALFTFLITNFSGNKHYWKHIFWTPGIPIIMRVIILPIELIGVFSKPISLMIRLFAAITAGHIVLLSFIGLIFIFQSYFVGVMSALFVVGLNLVELMVAGIQAYVFTMFSSVYIGLATEDGH